MLLARMTGAVQGLFYCVIIAVVLAALATYFRRTSRPKPYVPEPTPEPQNPPGEYVPGIQAAMQRAVDGDDKGGPVILNIGDRGTQESKGIPDISANVVVNDYRAREPEGLPDEVSPRELQEPERRGGGWLAPASEVMSQATAANRIKQMDRYRRDRDAQILEEATQEAIAALSDAQRAELTAQGGEAALRAHVEPAVKEFMVMLANDTAKMTGEMLAGEKTRAGEHVARPSDAKFQRGLMALTGGYSPPQMPAEAAEQTV